MTDTNHLITPPPELIRELIEGTPLATGVAREMHLITAAFQAGADQELEACCEWFSADRGYHHSVSADLRAGRRPQPPSLKELALAVLDDASNRIDAAHENIIRRALENLPD